MRQSSSFSYGEVQVLSKDPAIHSVIRFTVKANILNTDNSGRGVVSGIVYIGVLVAIWPGRFVPEMKNYSEDKFELRSPLTEKEIYDRLQERTLKKKWLSMSWTNKELIGHINSKSFSVISSPFPLPYGAACVVNGKVKPTSEITLTTTLHKAFRILFLVWQIFMTVGLIFTWFSESGGLVGAFWIMLGMGIVGFILRLYLHGMYLWARRDVMEKLKRILEIGY